MSGWSFASRTLLKLFPFFLLCFDPARIPDVSSLKSSGFGILFFGLWKAQSALQQMYKKTTKKTNA